MITLDYRDKRPIYEQVTEKLSHLIVCGALDENTKLPSVRQLALSLSVNPNTIQRAYSELESKGYIYTVVGRGNFVSEKKSWAGALDSALEAAIQSLVQTALASGYSKESLLQSISQIYEKMIKEANND
ncbi:MAG: GntR family transcriptional regulator [Acetatifactor sp.]|nr:GntR family transcriptional regulator [Acetatifactor sp.]